MQILIGSENPTKVNAVKAAFSEYTVVPHAVSSEVSSQPLSDQETRKGAINRALQCAKDSPSGIGLGLEGGIMFVEDSLYLCNWGALITGEEEIYTASGARILLPSQFQILLEAGIELGEIMEQFTMKEDIRINEGAIGIFTNDIISREEMFIHVVQLLRGQWEYAVK